MKLNTVKLRLDPMARFEIVAIPEDLETALDTRFFKGKYLTKSADHSCEISYYTEKSAKHLCYACVRCELVKAIQVVNNCGIEEGKTYLRITEMSFTGKSRTEYLAATK